MSKVMISLTFDDGLIEHLELIIPLLDKYTLRGTFYINLSAPTIDSHLDEWKAAFTRGHELGNHTIFHPAVAAKSWVSDGIVLENYSIDRMQKELEVANTILTMIDGKRERTFAYPCCNSVLGCPGFVARCLRQAGLNRTRLMGWIKDRPSLDFGSTERNYSSIMPGLFIAARAGEALPGTETNYPPNRFKIPCISADGCSAAVLRDKVAGLIERQRWLVFMFHGFEGGHHLNNDVREFEKFLVFLSENSGVEVQPVIDVAKSIWS